MTTSATAWDMIWPWTRSAASASPPAGGEHGRDWALDILEALPDPALLLDGRGTVVATNGRAAEALGMDATGQHLSAAIRAPGVLAALDQAFETGAPSRAGYDVPAPVARHFDVHIAPIGGTAARALVLLRDLTREQQTERLRADFVANASHELRTPLASLMGFIETLQGAARDDLKAREKFLGLMKAQGERMARLIGDLLSLSRVEMNEHVQPRAEVDLGQAARHVCDVLAPLAREAGAEIALAVDGKLPVSGNWDELVQVVQNLIENAIRYAAGGKRIEVTGHLAGTHAVLAVRDHGPGIARDHIPRLTERFYRVNAHESRQRGGTGLGLAIVKHILNRHRGRLTVESEPGRGSTFTIRIPARVP